jgi:Tol biopolymer transport system component
MAKMTKRKLFNIFLSLTILSLNFCSGGDQKIIEEVKLEELKPEISFVGKIIFHSNFDGDNEIYLLTTEGLTKLTDNTWNDEYPGWSPDGEKIVFTANPDGPYNIFLMNPDGSDITALTSSPEDDKEPSWFPDGKSVAFSREKGRSTALYRVYLDTQNTEKIIPDYTKRHGIPNISPTDPIITFTGKQRFGWDAAVYDMEKNQVTFLDKGGKSCRARFSKDGKKLAYVSSKADGKGDIWMMNPDGSQKIRLTEREKTYDYFPAWSPDGKYIVFNSSKKHGHNDDWQLYIFEIETGKTTLLFDSPGNDVFPDWK